MFVGTQVFFFNALKQVSHEYDNRKQEEIMDLPNCGLDSGDNAWLLTASAFVFLMTFGLSLFYSSLVEQQHVLDTLFKTVICMGVISIQWVLFGYSLAYSTGSPFIGDFKYAGLSGFADVNLYDDSQSCGSLESYEDYASSVPLLTYVVYQLSFAVITPSLISGAIVGRLVIFEKIVWVEYMHRMEFFRYCIFAFLWVTFVYCFVAHWVRIEKACN